MAIAVSIAGIAFAAFCVWLVVRIVNRRERWAKWTLAMALGLPLLYVGSFGPASRLAAQGEFDVRTFARVYWPLISMASKSEIAHNAINWYAGVWTDGSVRME